MPEPDGDRCRSVLEAGWRPLPGYTAPSPHKYPYQWLWDSCFHAIAWASLGDHRGVRELETLFATQLPNGFLPNMAFHGHPWLSHATWRNHFTSDITQPPMYGHALRVLTEKGFDVRHLHAPATRAMRVLMDSRYDATTGLLRIVHPWESGCDDSPRWDSWIPGTFNRKRWNVQKVLLARTLRMRDGMSWDNPAFRVSSASFNALTIFNARELAHLTGDAALLHRADSLARALDAQWVPALRTWRDVAHGAPRASSEARTIDALLGVLVTDDPVKRDAAWSAVFDSAEFWTHFGPAGVSQRETTFSPDTYWRGTSWPQLTYLLWVGAVRQGRTMEAARLGAALERGARVSGYAEHWNPFTGKGLGAITQSWTAVTHAVHRRTAAPTRPAPIRTPGAPSPAPQGDPPATPPPRMVA